MVSVHNRRTKVKYKINLEGDANVDDITSIFEDLVRSLDIISTENTTVGGSLTVDSKTIKSSDVDLEQDMSGPDVEPLDN